MARTSSSQARRSPPPARRPSRSSPATESMSPSIASATPGYCTFRQMARPSLRRRARCTWPSEGPAGGGSERDRFDAHLAKARAADLLLQFAPDHAPLERGGSVLERVQRRGHFIGQEMLAVERHDLADLDHAALELAQLVHEVAGL